MLINLLEALSQRRISTGTANDTRERDDGT